MEVTTHGQCKGALTLPSVPRSVAEARRFAVAVCVDSGFDAACDSVSLLVSEVITNALVHGDGEVRVHVERLGDRIHVEVSDDSSVLPILKPAGPDAEGGRGLGLVNALAAEWGVRLNAPRGKTVWFQVTR